MRTYKQRMPDDFHLHLRSGAMLKAVLPYTVEQFGRATVMPNLHPDPILMGLQAEMYGNEIMSYGFNSFKPLMTIQITEKTTAQMIRQAQEAGVIAGKIYPKGMTTNSENGVVDYKSLHKVFLQMEASQMVLLLHGEHPHSTSSLYRERDFMDTLDYIAGKYPTLKIVLEHVTTAYAISTVKMFKNVAATITLHHLLLTLDDVIGGKLKPHNFCKPIAKFESDREAIVEAAFSGSHKFFFGSDSAPHQRSTKECEEGCAGIFTAPVIMPMLVEFFEKHGKLRLLENFTARYGAEFYGLPRNEGILELVNVPNHLPKEISIPELNDSVVVFQGGQTISWSIKGVSHA
jgi:dihydroorotase